MSDYDSFPERASIVELRAGITKIVRVRIQIKIYNQTANTRAGLPPAGCTFLHANHMDERYPIKKQNAHGAPASPCSQA